MTDFSADKLRALDEAAEATMTRTMTSQESGALLAYLWDNRAAILAMAEREKRMREAVKTIMARCEALEDEAYNGVATASANDRDKTHEAGFWRGQKDAAKSIRRELHDLTRGLGE